MKIVLTILAIIILLAAIIAGYFWYSMSKPLYQPGMVRDGVNLGAPLSPPEQSGDPDFWQVEEDIQLKHFSAGAGRNVLVIHGGPGYPYLQAWPGLEGLAGQYRFHFYDQRGCGESTRPFQTFDSKNYYENMSNLDKTLGLGAQLADIERIRHILGEERLILVGHSFGGFLASLYAAEFPEHVAALVLIAPAETLVMPPPSGGLFAQVGERLPAEMQAEYEAFIAEYLSFGDIFSKSEDDLIALNQEFGQYYQAVFPADLPEQGRAGGWMVWAMYISMGQRHDYRPALAVVTAPALVIHGADDLQSEDASRIYSQALPNARFAIIQDATHFPFIEQPDEFGRLLADFLAGLQ